MSFNYQNENYLLSIKTEGEKKCFVREIKIPIKIIFLSMQGLSLLAVTVLNVIIEDKNKKKEYLFII